MNDPRLEENPTLSLLRRKKSVFILMWVIGWSAAALSVLAGIHNSVLYSQDFQWSATALLLRHIDPWQYMEAGGEGGNYGGILGPTTSYFTAYYLHFLYLILSPLGALSFPVARSLWAVLNLIFSGISLWLLKNLFHLSPAEWGVTCIVFLCGTSFRNCLGNGQQTLLVWMFVMLAYNAHRPWRRSLCFGLSYFKYSFAPPFFFDLLLSQPVRIVLVSLLPAAIGVFWAHWMLGGPWLHLILEPIIVAKTISPGSGDLMGLMTKLFPMPHDSSILNMVFSYALPILAAGAIAWYMRYRSGLRGATLTQAMAAIYSTASLLLFRHLEYDYLFLAAPLALAIKYRSQPVARGILFCVGYFWFFLKIEAMLHLHFDSLLLAFNFLLLSLITLLLLRISYADLDESPKNV